jgi:hypothetical protein
MLIARIYPLMTVYTVRGGQRKGSKHVINFPQNVSRLATVLPQLPVDVPLIVRRANLTEEKHYDFRVRRGKIEAALNWLKASNKWYQNVTISEERLSQLPMDDNLEHVFVRETTELDLPDLPGIQAETAQVGADSTTEEVITSDPDMGTCKCFSNIDNRSR